MTPEETRAEKIKASREAVRLHMECAMPGRKNEWSKGSAGRREALREAKAKKAKERPAKPAAPAPAESGPADSALEATLSKFARQDERNAAARKTPDADEGSFWFQSK